MATYIKTEHFFKREEWSIITPYQAEIKMFHVLQNKFALLRKQGNNTVVDYSR